VPSIIDDIAPFAESLHAAMIDLVDEISRPRRDDRLIEEAGIPLDRALFPLLAGVWRNGRLEY
jgi:hypothetical protein